MYTASYIKRVNIRLNYVVTVMLNHCDVICDK